MPGAVAARPKPTTSAQASASITTLRCVRRLSASTEKLFMTCAPKTSLSLVGASRRKVHGGGLIIAAVRHGRRSEPLGQTLIVLNLARHPTAGRLLHCGIAIGSMSALGSEAEITRHLANVRFTPAGSTGHC